MNSPSKQLSSRKRPTIAIVGAGSLASGLGIALAEAQYRITQVVVRDRPRSLTRGRGLARKLGAELVTLGAPLDVDLIWLCVRDDAVSAVAKELAQSADSMRAKAVFHSSGVLGSGALAPLGVAGARVAAVHPIMTFVGQAQPSFEGVWFGVEGDSAAVRIARQIVGQLGGSVLLINAHNKALYHAWGAFASPLLVATLALAEEIGLAAGMTEEVAHRGIWPLVRQTISNYSAKGAAAAFSGPLRRGDVATVARHLEALRAIPRAQAAYMALARSALHTLPVRSRERLRRLLGDAGDQ
jgi:predicted short-subunit dehydrogenase-like oxidoreductase (DUF2520 family)